jgi:hypothetical protein
VHYGKNITSVLDPADTGHPSVSAAGTGTVQVQYSTGIGTGIGRYRYRYRYRYKTGGGKDIGEVDFYFGILQR